MFDACIDTDCGDHEPWECKKHVPNNKSDTPHKCCECGCTIEPGTEHDLWIPVCEADVDENDPDKYHPGDICGFSEDPEEFRTCIGCKRIWDGLGNGTQVFGALNEYLDYATGITVNDKCEDYGGIEQFDDLSRRCQGAHMAARVACQGKDLEWRLVLAMELLEPFLTDEQFAQVMEMAMSVGNKE